MIATGTRRRSPDPGRRVSPASRARGSSVACSPACACQRCATSHSTYEPGAQQASVSASIETSPLGGEKGWEVRLLPAESNAKLDLPLRISMLSEALPDGWVTRNPQKKTKHAQGQAQKVVRAGHRKAKLHPDLHFRRVIEGDADGVKMKNLFEISLLSKCGDVVHAVKLEQISTHATDPWCMSAEAPGDLQHVPVHLILTLANVASSTVGSRGSTQRDVFETLLARDLAAASDLDSTAFRIASLEETDGQAVAARSEGVQGQDDAEEADGNEEVQVTEEGDLEEASVKFCFSGGNLQTSNTRVTVRAEIEILAQGDSDTLARRGLCAESIVAVRKHMRLSAASAPLVHVPRPRVTAGAFAVDMEDNQSEIMRELQEAGLLVVDGHASAEQPEHSDSRNASRLSTFTKAAGAESASRQTRGTKTNADRYVTVTEDSSSLDAICLNRACARRGDSLQARHAELSLQLAVCERASADKDRELEKLRAVSRFYLPQEAHDADELLRRKESRLKTAEEEITILRKSLYDAQKLITDSADNRNELTNQLAIMDERIEESQAELKRCQEQLRLAVQWGEDELQKRSEEICALHTRFAEEVKEQAAKMQAGHQLAMYSLQTELETTLQTNAEQGQRHFLELSHYSGIITQLRCDLDESADGLKRYEQMVLRGGAEADARDLIMENQANELSMLSQTARKQENELAVARAELIQRASELSQKGWALSERDGMLAAKDGMLAALRRDAGASKRAAKEAAQEAALMETCLREMDDHTKSLEKLLAEKQQGAAELEAGLEASRLHVARLKEDIERHEQSFRQKLCTSKDGLKNSETVIAQQRTRITSLQTELKEAILASAEASDLLADMNGQLQTMAASALDHEGVLKERAGMLLMLKHGEHELARLRHAEGLLSSKDDEIELLRGEAKAKSDAFDQKEAELERCQQELQLAIGSAVEKEAELVAAFEDAGHQRAYLEQAEKRLKQVEREHVIALGEVAGGVTLSIYERHAELKSELARCLELLYMSQEQMNWEKHITQMPSSTDAALGQESGGGTDRNCHTSRRANEDKIAGADEPTDEAIVLRRRNKGGERMVTDLSSGSVVKPLAFAASLPRVSAGDMQDAGGAEQETRRISVQTPELAFTTTVASASPLQTLFSALGVTGQQSEGERQQDTDCFKAEGDEFQEEQLRQDEWLLEQMPLGEVLRSEDMSRHPSSVATLPGMETGRATCESQDEDLLILIDGHSFSALDPSLPVALEPSNASETHHHRLGSAVGMSAAPLFVPPPSHTDPALGVPWQPPSHADLTVGFFTSPQQTSQSQVIEQPSTSSRASIAGSPPPGEAMWRILGGKQSTGQESSQSSPQPPCHPSWVEARAAFELAETEWRTDILEHLRSFYIQYAPEMLGKTKDVVDLYQADVTALDAALRSKYSVGFGNLFHCPRSERQPSNYDHDAIPSGTHGPSSCDLCRQFREVHAPIEPSVSYRQTRFGLQASAPVSAM